MALELVGKVSFNVLPNFASEVLSDSTPAITAIQFVCAQKGRNQESAAIAHSLSSVSNMALSTVGDLRKLSDRDWHSLPLPAMCRVYLKYLVRQSGRSQDVGSPIVANSTLSPFMQSLANDFNFGSPFNMDVMNPMVDMLVPMGFTRDQAMEALCIVDNKVDLAIEILIQNDPGQVKKRREEAKNKRPKNPPNKSPGGGGSSSAGGGVTSTASITDRELQELRRDKSDAESKLAKLKDDMNKYAYKEFLRGVIADEAVSSASLEAMHKYMVELKISEGDHLQALKELGFTRESFDIMKKFGGKERCIVCLEQPKNIVVIPCMHLCLCEVCAENTIKKNKSPKCPMCQKKLEKTMPIFY